MRDEDLYFVAFSVEEIPSEEEMARGIQAVRSPCFKFKDADNILPDFLDVEVIDLKYSYGPAYVSCLTFTYDSPFFGYSQ